MILAKLPVGVMCPGIPSYRRYVIYSLLAQLLFIITPLLYDILSQENHWFQQDPHDMHRQTLPRMVLI